MLLLILTGAFAVMAALVHAYIFVLESLRWEEPRTRAVFGTDAESARVTAPMAYNQGFYNLFLAIGAVAGVVALGLDRAVATALIGLSAGSMLAAALVLVLSDPSKARPAAIQGAFPAATLVALLLTLVLVPA